MDWSAVLCCVIFVQMKGKTALNIINSCSNIRNGVVLVIKTNTLTRNRMHGNNVVASTRLNTRH